MAGGGRWVKLDVNYFANSKVHAAGLEGQVLHLASICWCAEQLTDGHIPASFRFQLCRMAGVRPRAIRLVVDAGLWVQTDGGDYYVKDFLEHQDSRGQVERERELWRQRQKRHRTSDGRFTSGN